MSLQVIFTQAEAEYRRQRITADFQRHPAGGRKRGILGHAGAGPAPEVQSPLMAARRSVTIQAPLAGAGAGGASDVAARYAGAGGAVGVQSPLPETGAAPALPAEAAPDAGARHPQADRKTFSHGRHRWGRSAAVPKPEKVATRS